VGEQGFDWVRVGGGGRRGGKTWWGGFGGRSWREARREGKKMSREGGLDDSL